MQDYQCLLLGLFSVAFQCLVSMIGGNPEELRKTRRGTAYYFRCNLPRTFISHQNSRHTLTSQVWEVSILSQSAIEFSMQARDSNFKVRDKSELMSGDIVFDRNIILNRCDAVLLKQISDSEQLRAEILNALSLGAACLLSKPRSRLVAVIKSLGSNEVILPRQKTMAAIVDCLTNIESYLPK